MHKPVRVKCMALLLGTFLGAKFSLNCALLTVGLYLENVGGVTVFHVKRRRFCQTRKVKRTAGSGKIKHWLCPVNLQNKCNFL